MSDHTDDNGLSEDEIITLARELLSADYAATFGIQSRIDKIVRLFPDIVELAMGLRSHLDITDGFLGVETRRAETLELKLAKAEHTLRELSATELATDGYS